MDNLVLVSTVVVLAWRGDKGLQQVRCAATAAGDVGLLRRLLLLLLQAAQLLQEDCLTPLDRTRVMLTRSRFIFLTATTSGVGLHSARCTCGPGGGAEAR